MQSYIVNGGEKVEGEIKIYLNSNLRKFSRINLKEELENIEFKRQNENEKEQKQMQK